MANNPVFNTRGIFTTSQPQYVAPAQGVNGNPAPAPGAPWGYQQPYAVPGAQPGYGQMPPGYGPVGYQQPSATADRMTIDDVLQKTAISLGFLFLVAAFGYYFLPDQILYPAGLIGGLVAFIVPFVVIKRRTTGPAVNIVYAIGEGLLVGGFSKLFEMVFPGIVLQAVLATFVTAGVVLVAYHFAGVRVSSRMANIVRFGLLGFCGVAVINLVLYFFNVNLGLFPAPGQPVSIWAWILALVGAGLAVFSLLQDFQVIDAGIRMGAPREQGWMAAFGLSVTMVWLYISLLRLLSYIRR